METYTFAPAKIAKKAKQLASAGEYKKAFDLLNNNIFIFDISNNEIKVELPADTIKIKQLSGAAKLAHERKMRQANANL